MERQFLWSTLWRDSSEIIWLCQHSPEMQLDPPFLNRYFSFENLDKYLYFRVLLTKWWKCWTRCWKQILIVCKGTLHLQRYEAMILAVQSLTLQEDVFDLVRDFSRRLPVPYSMASLTLFIKSIEWIKRAEPSDNLIGAKCRVKVRFTIAETKTHITLYSLLLAAFTRFRCSCEIDLLLERIFHLWASRCEHTCAPFGNGRSGADELPANYDRPEVA